MNTLKIRKGEGRTMSDFSNKSNGGETMEIRGIHFKVPKDFRDRARQFAEDHGVTFKALIVAGLLNQLEAGEPVGVKKMTKRIEQICGGQEAA
jgi:hypothetical protein